MVEERTRSSNDSKPKKKRQKIPFITVTLALICRYVSLSFLAGGVFLASSAALYSWDYYNGIHDYERSYNTYVAALDYAGKTGTWMDVLSQYANITDYVHRWYIKGKKLVSEGANQVGDNYASVNDSKSKYSINNILNVLQAGWENQKTQASNMLVINSMGQVTSYFSNLIYVWILTTCTWVIKMLTIVNFIPLYLVAAAFTVTHGLAQRKILTYTGERDSQDRVELFYGKSRITSITVLFLYVAIPFNIHPLFFFVPSIIATAFVLSKLAKNYKKYY